MENLNGSFIKGNELDILVREIFMTEKFTKLALAIKVLTQFKKEDLVVKVAYKFDMEIEENIIVSGKQVVFLNDQKTVQIVYREMLNYNLPESDKLAAQILVRNTNYSSLHSMSFDNNGVIQVDVISADYPGTEIEIVNEDLPDDPNYTPHPTGDLTTQAWWTSNGCLPGGYQHCGGNCGNTGDHGGGKTINYTDGCCKLHDDCYRSGIKKCKCDAMLIQCVRNETTVASMGIRLYFGPKAC